MKWFLAFLLMLPFSSFAEELSDECMHSMQKVYKFYYHEISPKGPQEVSSEPLNEAQVAQVQSLIEQLKVDCPTAAIAKMSEYLQEPTQRG